MPKRKAKKTVKRTEEQKNDDESDKGIQGEEKKEEEEGINCSNTQLQILRMFNWVSLYCSLSKSESANSFFFLSSIIVLRYIVFD